MVKKNNLHAWLNQFQNFNFSNSMVAQAGELAVETGEWRSEGEGGYTIFKQDFI